MVQREVKNKTGKYAIAAVLSAVMLVSVIYVFGAVPTVFPPSQSPTVGGMKTFSSNQQIIDYLTANQQGYGASRGPLDSKFFGSGPAPVPAQVTSGIEGFLGLGETSSYTSQQSDASDYSGTNIQVAGVDEADTVKTDGHYLYTISNTVPNSIFYYSTSQAQNLNVVYIVDADPQNAHVVSKIEMGNDTQPAGLYLSSDGNKLAVIASKYQFANNGASLMGGEDPLIMPYYQADVYTYINIYDVSDKIAPVLTRNFTASGSYFNSRMIGDDIYAVVSQTAWVYNGVVSLPTVYENKNSYSAAPSSIYYADMNDSSFSFTSFYGLDLANDNVAATNMTVMMGGASTMYVSADNMYITYPNWEPDSGSYTSIYRVAIDGLQLLFEAEGSVPGNTINQYSMDEYNGVLRVATNWYSIEGGQVNNVYALNLDLSVVGKLEGLAQNENLHAVRFMGDKCYLVTYQKTDPLFVIDLSQPRNPTVLGELKIPGYSDYLHPYDETHLIGLGKEALEAEEGDFAWYQGLKLSLFDVGDVSNPIQLANVTIGDRGSDSLALTDPHAFLFDKSRNLLVVPLSLALVPEQSRQYGASAYGQTVWQGVYVYSLSVDGGFTLQDRISHLDPALLGSDGNLKNTEDYYSTINNWVTRSLYIGNVLYTVSAGEVKLNSLSGLSQIAEVPLI